MMRPDAGSSRGRGGGGGGGTEVKYKGVRKRKWGKWVSEVRLPNSRERIWLGSYDSAEKAARAFDAAACCLRGRKAQLNFPDNPPQVPAAQSLTHQQVQAAAASHARSVPEPATTSTANTTTEADSPPSEANEEAAPPLATKDWSFLDYMTDEFPVINEFYYDFLSPTAAQVGQAADTAAAAEECGNGFGTSSFLWNF